jgi:hypothetical protein
MRLKKEYNQLVKKELSKIKKDKDYKSQQTSQNQHELSKSPDLNRYTNAAFNVSKSPYMNNSKVVDMSKKRTENNSLLKQHYQTQTKEHSAVSSVNHSGKQSSTN